MTGQEVIDAIRAARAEAKPILIADWDDGLNVANHLCCTRDGLLQFLAVLTVGQCKRKH